MTKSKTRRAKPKANKLITQSRDNHHQQLPQTQAQAENSNKEQQQISLSDITTGWFPIAVVVLPVLVSFGLSAVSIFYHSHFILAILSLFVTIASFLFVVYLLLRQHKWKKDHHFKPLRNSFLVIGAIVLLGCLVIVVRQTRQPKAPKPTLNANKQVSTVSSPLNAHKVFDIKKLNLIMFPVYPQPLLYVYTYSPYVTGLPSERVIAPIGLAINLEVVNDGPTATKIESYAAELDTEPNEWTRINRLPMTKPHDIYFADGNSLKSCVKFEFKPNIFDVVALQKTLLPGDSLDGWIFFEWPIELHANKKLHNIRIRVQNSQGESEEAIFNVLSDDNNERGVSLINEGSFGAKGLKAKREDLSSLPIRPFESE